MYLLCLLILEILITQQGKMLIDTYHLVQNVLHTSLCEYKKKVKKDELFFNNTGNYTFQTIKEAIKLIISYRL